MPIPMPIPRTQFATDTSWIIAHLEASAVASSKTDDFSFLLASHPEMSEELAKLVQKRQMRLSRHIAPEPHLSHHPNPNPYA